LCALEGTFAAGFICNKKPKSEKKNKWVETKEGKLTQYPVGETNCRVKNETRMNLA